MLHGLVDIVHGDDQRRREPDHVLVRLLAQHASLHEPLAVLAGTTGLVHQLHADEQALAAHLVHQRRLHVREEPPEVLAQGAGPVHQVVFLEHTQGLTPHSCGQRVAAERGAVVAGPEHAHDVTAGQSRGHRQHTATQGLAHEQHVGLGILVLVGEALAATAEPGLDLVEHQQDAPAGADLAHLGQVTGVGHFHAGLTLDRLHQEGHGVGTDRGFQRVRVVVRNLDETRCVRTEPPLVLFVVGEADDGGGPAMEVAIADHDLGRTRDVHDLVAPHAHGLDGGLDRLGARVHGQSHVHAAELAQLPQERPELVVVEGAGRQRQPLGLLHQGPDDRGVAVAVVDGRVGRQHVHVPLAIRVLDPDALASGDDHGKRVVVVGPELFGHLNDTCILAQNFTYSSLADFRLWHLSKKTIKKQPLY